MLDTPLQHGILGIQGSREGTHKESYSSLHVWPHAETPLCTTRGGCILSYIWLGPAAETAHTHPSWTSQRMVSASRTCKCYIFSDWKALKLHAAGRMLGVSAHSQDSPPSLGGTESCKGEALAKRKGNISLPSGLSLPKKGNINIVSDGWQRVKCPRQGAVRLKEK